MNLIEIWGNTEKILYTIGNKEGEIPRVRAAEDLALIQLKVEEDRETYIRRYNVNSELLRQNPNIERDITRKTSQTPIDIKKIVKKILGEEEGIKESDYVAGIGIIEHDLDKRQNII